MQRLNKTFFGKHVNDDDEVVLVVHKHWLRGLRYLFWPTVSFGVTAYLIVNYNQVQLLLYILSGWGVATVVWWLRNFLDYYLDAWVITNQGVVDVSWHGWFHRESARVLYTDIQGVSYEISGIGNTVFRFGTITIEKVSKGKDISLSSVAHPKRVETVILKQMERYMHSRNMKDATQIQDLLVNVLAREMHLKDINKQTKES